MCNINRKWKRFFKSKHLWSSNWNSFYQQRTDLKNSHSHLAKRDNLLELSIKYLEQQISELKKLGKLVNKKLKVQGTRFLLHCKHPFSWRYTPVPRTLHFIHSKHVFYETGYWGCSWWHNKILRWIEGN